MAGCLHRFPFVGPDNVLNSGGGLVDALVPTALLLAGQEARLLPIVVPAKAGTHSSTSRDSDAGGHALRDIIGSCRGTLDPSLRRGDEERSGENRIAPSLAAQPAVLVAPVQWRVTPRG